LLHSPILRTALSIAIASQLLAASDLAIPPVQQNTPEWCWLAVGEMVFRHYGVPNLNPAGIYQCGVVGVMVGGPCAADCRYCANMPAYNVVNIRRMITEYPGVARNYLRDRRIPQLDARIAARALTAGEIREEIDADRPIIAGISPTGSGRGSPQHAVLIVGYSGDRDGIELTVNDPYPYGRYSPYQALGGNGGAGRYRISYARFKSRLRWTESVYEIAGR
jgi:hypothetical protein